MFWDGTRWVDERPTPTPAVFHGPRRLRDWIATIPIVLLVPALLVPFLPAMATTAGPSLSVPGPVTAGATVAVTANGFTSGTMLQLQWDGSSSGMPTVRTRSSRQPGAEPPRPVEGKGGDARTVRRPARVGPIWRALRVGIDDASAQPDRSGLDQCDGRRGGLRHRPATTGPHGRPTVAPTAAPTPRAHRGPHGPADGPPPPRRRPPPRRPRRPGAPPGAALHGPHAAGHARRRGPVERDHLRPAVRQPAGRRGRRRGAPRRPRRDDHGRRCSGNTGDIYVVDSTNVTVTEPLPQRQGQQRRLGPLELHRVQPHDRASYIGHNKGLGGDTEDDPVALPVAGRPRRQRGRPHRGHGICRGHDLDRAISALRLDASADAGGSHLVIRDNTPVPRPGRHRGQRGHRHPRPRQRHVYGAQRANSNVGLSVSHQTSGTCSAVEVAGTHAVALGTPHRARRGADPAHWDAVGPTAGQRSQLAVAGVSTNDWHAALDPAGLHVSRRRTPHRGPRPARSAPLYHAPRAAPAGRCGPTGRLR